MSQDVVADDDLAALFGGDESSDAEDYDPSAAPQGSGSDAGGDSGDDTDPGEVRDMRTRLNGSQVMPLGDAL